MDQQLVKRACEKISTELTDGDGNSIVTGDPASLDGTILVPIDPNLKYGNVCSFAPAWLSIDDFEEGFLYCSVDEKWGPVALD